jgi:beta-galactosidase
VPESASNNKEEDSGNQAKLIRFSPWGWEPVIESWTYPGQEGTTTRVDVYSADQEVELLLNGTVVGRKPAGAAQQNKASFEVAYAPGILEAVAYTGGQETGRTTLTTADAPVALRLTPDRATIGAAAGDLSYVTVEIVDAQGAVVQHATHRVTLEITGAGELIAIGTPDPRQTTVVDLIRRFIKLGLIAAKIEDTPGAALIIRDGDTEQ